MTDNECVLSISLVVTGKCFLTDSSVLITQAIYIEIISTLS